MKNRPESRYPPSLHGQTKDKINQCEKSRSTLFILSERNDDLIVMQNVRIEFRQN